MIWIDKRSDIKHDVRISNSPVITRAEIHPLPLEPIGASDVVIVSVKNELEWLYLRLG